ncbi:hypothetical protein [Prochlorococcus sp. MIT 1223]|uniref:hypothetical protein n=1 Tax=Prochlorococcus sp. MIT 1223 TaxID=3096217 RepID=UPI002A757C06|nr:hypothetical protein [Prochlorococcus sp. MIT 1223]
MDINQKKYKINVKSISTKRMLGIDTSKFNGRQNPSGFLYTYYKSNDNTIIIGYAKSLIDLETKKELVGYNLIDKRPGIQSEFRLLKHSLNLQGYLQDSYIDSYFLSKNLMHKLALLGWPIGDKDNTKKIYKRMMKNS